MSAKQRIGQHMIFIRIAEPRDSEIAVFSCKKRVHSYRKPCNIRRKIAVARSTLTPLC
jgi:hypothetical protein